MELLPLIPLLTAIVGFLSLIVAFVWRLPEWGHRWLAFLRDLRSYRAGL